MLIPFALGIHAIPSTLYIFKTAFLVASIFSINEVEFSKNFQSHDCQESFLLAVIYVNLNVIILSCNRTMISDVKHTSRSGSRLHFAYTLLTLFGKICNYYKTRRWSGEDFHEWATWLGIYLADLLQVNLNSSRSRDLTQTWRKQNCKVVACHFLSPCNPADRLPCSLWVRIVQTLYGNVDLIPFARHRARALLWSKSSNLQHHSCKSGLIPFFPFKRAAKRYCFAGKRQSRMS